MSQRHSCLAERVKRFASVLQICRRAEMTDLLDWLEQRLPRVCPVKRSQQRRRGDMRLGGLRVEFFHIVNRKRSGQRIREGEEIFDRFALLAGQCGKRQRGVRDLRVHRVGGIGAVHFRLTVQQQVSIYDNLLPGSDAVEHLGQLVAVTPELEHSARVTTAALIHKRDGLRSGLNDCRARNGEGLRCVQLHDSIGIETMREESPSVHKRVIQLNAHLRRACGFIEVWVNELDHARHNFSWERWRGDIHFLPGVNPRQVLLVGAELKPHRRKVRDLKQLLALLHVLAGVDFLLHHRATDRCKDL